MNLKFTDHPAGGGVSERKIGNGDVTIQDFKNAQLDMIRLLSGDKIGDYLVTRVDVEFRHRARGADGAETTDLIFPADDPAQLPGWDGRDAIISSVIVRGLVTHAHGGSTHDYSSKSSSSGA